MITFETSVRIGRLIEDVFAFVSDPLRFPRWNSAVHSVHNTSGRTSGVGSTCSMERELHPQTAKSAWTDPGAWSDGPRTLVVHWPTMEVSLKVDAPEKGGRYKARLEFTDEESRTPALMLGLEMERSDGIWQLSRIALNDQDVFRDGLELDYPELWNILDRMGKSASGRKDRTSRRDYQ